MIYCHQQLISPPPTLFAVITIFILLTGEWVQAMHPVTAILGAPASLFFVAVVLIGKFLLMNLLVAVILTEFQVEESDWAASSPGTALTAVRGGRINSVFVRRVAAVGSVAPHGDTAEE